MGNFFSCLKMFQNSGDITCDNEVYQYSEIECPTIQQASEVVKSFFEGRNVCYVDISTHDGFNYRATVVDEHVFSENEFKHDIITVLEEQGITAKTSVKKERSGLNSSNFLVEIHVNPNN